MIAKMNKPSQYDIVFVGGGVSGSAGVNVAAKYTDIQSMAILEKGDNF